MAQRLSPLERQIMQSLVAHISQNEEVSLTELAEECHVSKSSAYVVMPSISGTGFEMSSLQPVKGMISERTIRTAMIFLIHHLPS